MSAAVLASVFSTSMVVIEDGRAAVAADVRVVAAPGVAATVAAVVAGAAVGAVAVATVEVVVGVVAVPALFGAALQPGVPVVADAPAAVDALGLLGVPAAVAADVVAPAVVATRVALAGSA